jgi:hypothetical protein
MTQTILAKPEENDTEKEPLLERSNFGGSWQEKDLTYGQPVIVAVRWIMIVSALVLAIWNVTSMHELRLQIVVILLLAVTNFYLQAQLLMKRPVNKQIVYGASAVDILLITILIMFQGGYSSSIYVFYLPAIAAFAVAFPRGLTAIYTAVVLLVYGFICLTNGAGNVDVIVSRLLMITAVAFCGSLYLQLEHKRLAEAKTREEENFLENMPVQAMVE